MLNDTLSKIPLTLLKFVFLLETYLYGVFLQEYMLVVPLSGSYSSNVEFDNSRDYVGVLSEQVILYQVGISYL